MALLPSAQKGKIVTVTGIEMYYKPVSRVLTGTEIQLFSYCGEEREAVALAQFVSLPDNASYDMIEQAVTQGLVAMKLSAGCDPSVEVIHAERRGNRRPN